MSHPFTQLRYGSEHPLHELRRLVGLNMPGTRSLHVCVWCVLVRTAGLWNWKKSRLFQYNHLFFSASLLTISIHMDFILQVHV